MAINNLNPRRVVWFSPNEPSNKYDIWLSRNAHYDENGEPTTDSNVQRDCDYIFKIYDCGKWNPIVGFNSTAKFKINTVANIEYLYTYNGTTYTSDSIQQFHLPLFRDPDDSPAELFDAGTIGEAILKFVNESEWSNIINSDSFQDAWDTNISSINIRPAEVNELGGIYASRYGQSYSGDNFLVKCKYKYQPSNQTPDYNLYVHVKDIYESMSEYVDDNGIDAAIENMLFNIFENSASIMKGWHELSEDATSLEILANKPRFILGGDPWNCPENRGKFLKTKPNGDWYTLHGGEDYGILNSCWEYVDIHDELGGEDPNPSQWRVPVKGIYGINSEYTQLYDEYGETHEGYALRLHNYTNQTQQGSYCRTKKYFSLSIQPTRSGDSVWPYYDEVDVNTGIRTTYGLEWLTGDQLIKEETNYNLSTMSDKKVYLNCDQGILGWSEVSGGSDYTAGYGIDIDEDSVISGNITDNSSTSFTATERVTFRALNGGSSLRNAIVLRLDGSVDGTQLHPYNYYEILFDLNSPGFLDFEIDDQLEIMNGNPVYALLTVSGKTNGITISFGESSKLININNAVSNDLLNIEDYSLFLITLLFGIIKIEPVEIVSTSNNNE